MMGFFTVTKTEVLLWPLVFRKTGESIDIFNSY